MTVNMLVLTHVNKIWWDCIILTVYTQYTIVVVSYFMVVEPSPYEALSGHQTGRLSDQTENVVKV